MDNTSAVQSEFRGLPNGLAPINQYGFIPGQFIGPGSAYSSATFVVAPISSGAKADYYTDGIADEVQINAALVAASALGTGGTVLLKAGTYTLGASIVPLNNTWLRGDGMFTTKILTGVNARYAHIDNYAVYSPSNPWTNGMVTDMELDGSNQDRTVGKKGVNAVNLKNCKFSRLYIHDTTATGFGADDYYSVTVTECIVQNCGYTNKLTITAMSYASSTFTVTTSTAHGYAIGDSIVITSMVPAGYNGVYKVTTVTNSTVFTIGTSNNSGNLQLATDPGAATSFGNTSDLILGNNGIGIASGALAEESMVVSNNFCIGNQNNNYLIEADTSTTGSNASYIFSNNVSIRGGQTGYRNTGTLNVQFNNNYDYGSLIGIFVGSTSQSATITAASWASSVSTYTTSAAHGYAVGNYVTIAGMTPSGYNGWYYITTVPTTTTFTVANTVNPGAATVFGTSSLIVHPVASTTVNNNILSNNTLYGIQIFPHSDGVSARGNTIKSCLNYGAYLGSGHGVFSQNRVLNNGQDGIEILTGGNYQPLDNLHVTDNIVFNNSAVLANHDGISVTSNSTTPISNLTLSGNHCFDNQNTKTQRYGIIIRSGGNNSNILVTDNNVVGNLTGPILMQDTSNTIWCNNNVGLNPNGKYAAGNVTGAIAFDSLNGNYFTATLTGNITPTFPTNSRTIVGTEVIVEFTQDGTGSRTATWPANFKKAGGTLTLTTTAGATDTIKMVYDGTNWAEVSRSLNVS